MSLEAFTIVNKRPKLTTYRHPKLTPGEEVFLGSGQGDRRGRKHHVSAAIERFPIKVAIQTASTQDLNGAPAADPQNAGEGGAFREALGGCQWPNPVSELKKQGLGSTLGFVKKPKGSRFRTAAGSRSGSSLGCRAADAWRRTANGAWISRWRGRGWPHAASRCAGPKWLQHANNK